jgi:ubiquinone/menaquinone biosynthesis C-methylase UbiE
LNPSVYYFDHIADTYFQADYQETTGGRARRVRKTRLMELFDKPAKRVLDVGCGPGVLVEHLRRLGCDVWGVDGSVRMIEQAQQNYGRDKRVHFVVGDATALPFADNSFDALTCTGVIDRIDRHEVALREMVRVLQPGGTLLLAVPNLLSPNAFWRAYVYNPGVSLFRPLYYWLRRKPRKAYLTGWARLHMRRRYLNLVKAQHCAVQEVVYFNFNLLPSPLDDFFPRFAIKIADLAEPMRFGPFKWLGAAFLVKARKLEGNRPGSKKARRGSAEILPCTEKQTSAC